MDNQLQQDKLRGLCVICVRRRRCPKAYKYLELNECKAFKVHPRRGKSNKKAET